MAMQTYRDPLLAGPYRMMDELLRNWSADRTTGYFDAKGFPAPYFLSTAVSIPPRSARPSASSCRVAPCRCQNAYASCWARRAGKPKA